MKRYLTTAALLLVLATSTLAQDRQDPRPNAESLLHRIIRVIKHVIEPLDQVSPPHP
jgi:hypothetical protein